MWCKPKTTTLLTISLLTTLFICKYVYAQYATAQNIQVLFTSGSSLAFQNDANKTVTLEVVSGVLNSSQNKLRLDSGGGFFRFTALDDTKIKITYSGIGTLKVSGDKNNPLRVLTSGSTIAVDALNDVLIQWDIPVEPWWPIMFIFGMVGLGAMFVGPLYAIDKIKKREYLEGFRNGIVITVFGIAMFMAWLW